MSITKKDLSSELKNELKLSIELSDSLVDKFITSLKSALKSHEYIKLSGFGTFETFRTKERMGRNPKTMENFLIPSRKKVRFRLTSKAKYYLN